MASTPEETKDNLELKLDKVALPKDELYHGVEIQDEILPIEALKKDFIIPATVGEPTNKMATFRELFCAADSQDRWYIGIAFFMAFLSGCNQPAQLIIFGSILTAFNGATPAESVKLVSLLAGLYAVMGFQMFLSSFAQTALMSAAAGKQTKRLRELYFKSLLKQPVTYFDSNDQGALATSVMERTLIFQDGIGEKMALGVQFFIAFVAGLIVALYYVWELALLMMGVVPVMAVLIGIITKFLQSSSEDSLNAYAIAGSTAQQALGAIRTLFALGGEKREVSKYAKQLELAEKAGLRRWRATGLMAGSVSCIMWMTYALGLWFGAFLIARDMNARAECRYSLTINADGTESLHVPVRTCITGGNVMICFFSVLFGGLNLGQGFPAISAVQLAMIELGKILDVTRSTSPIDPTSEVGSIPEEIVGKIELRNVSFAYPMRPDHQVYNGLNITIEAGQTVALVGPSGCGKSTVVALVERFYDPSAGAVLLDGKDIKDLRVNWLRKQIGLVSQEPVLFTGSIYDNIAYGKDNATMEEIESAARMANAHDFISAFPDAYNTQVGEKGVQLSGGQKQRVAIARAIVRDPKILILDEATSALDSTSEKIVQEALDNLLKMKKRTTIVIAHRLSTIRDADKIVVLESGVVVEEGTHDSLLALETSLYATLVNMQITSMGDDAGDASNPGDKTDEIPSAEQLAQAYSVAPMPLESEAEAQIYIENKPDIENGAAQPTNKKDAVHDEEISLRDEEELQVMMSTKVGKGIIEAEAEVDKQSSSVAWIWALSAPERPYLVAGLFGAILLGASFPVLGFLLAQMIGIFFNPDSIDMMKKAAFLAYMFLAVAASQLVGVYLAQYCFGVMTEKLARRVREKSFLKMLQMEVTWFDRSENTAGTLAQQLATDCMMVKALTGERASTSASQIVTFIVSFAIAFYQCWEMTLVMVGLFPVIGMAFALQHKFVTSAAGASMTATNEAGSVASQTLLNIRTINAFGLEKISAISFEKNLVEPLKQFIKKGTVTGLGMGFSQLVILSGAGLAYYTGGQLVLLGRATFTQVIAVILTIMLGAIGLGQFAADASDKAEALTAAQKIQKLWDLKTTISAMSEEGEVPLITRGDIELRNVCFAYPMRPDHDVYNNMNLTIEAGQTVALVGPSGCGKSTAVALIERFYDPSAGAVLLDGKDIRTLRLSWLRQQIGLVSQEPVLFIGSIADNIAYGKDNATMEEIESAARMANAHDFISAFPDAYNTQVGEKGVQLSGGQKQRVAIARAIVRDPKILILDEATSALDTASEQVVQAALDNLLVIKKRTTIVIAHRLSTIKKADKIVVFSDGVVVEQGTHDELLLNSDGAYSALVRNSQRSIGDSEKAAI